MSRPVVSLGRKQAAELIEEIAAAMARGVNNGERSTRVHAILRDAGLLYTVCPSSCHEHEDQIDHCMTCAPRWGVVGPEVKVR